MVEFMREKSRKSRRSSEQIMKEVKMVEAAGIEPATFRSVQRGKFFWRKELSLRSRSHGISMQLVCSDFAARQCASTALPCKGSV